LGNTAPHRDPEIVWLSRSRTPHGVTRKHLLQTIRTCEKAVKRKFDRRRSTRQRPAGTLVNIPVTFSSRRDAQLAGAGKTAGENPLNRAALQGKALACGNA
jgi:hypothetical protein